MTTSQIDPSKPQSGTPTTASVRQNFLYARNEINRLFTSLGSTSGGFLQKALALGDITDKVLARNNLGINSAAFWNEEHFQSATAAATDAYNLTQLTTRVTAIENSAGTGEGAGSSVDAEYLSAQEVIELSSLKQAVDDAVTRVASLEQSGIAGSNNANADDTEYLDAQAEAETARMTTQLESALARIFVLETTGNSNTNTTLANHESRITTVEATSGGGLISDLEYLAAAA